MASIPRFQEETIPCPVCAQPGCGFSYEPPTEYDQLVAEVRAAPPDEKALVAFAGLMRLALGGVQ